MDLREIDFCRKIIFERNKYYQINELEELLKSINWEIVENPELFQESLIKSSHAIGAFYGNKLIGLIRSMDDFCWSANIDILLVHSSFQNMGIGSKLLEELLSDLRNVRHINAFPDSERMQHFFQRYSFKTNGLYMQKKNDV